jgi:hypothetical protein
LITVLMAEKKASSLALTNDCHTTIIFSKGRYSL